MLKIAYNMRMADDERNYEDQEPDFQREGIFHNDTVTIRDLENDNTTRREELAICQKIVEIMAVEIGQVKLENAILKAVFED